MSDPLTEAFWQFLVEGGHGTIGHHTWDPVEHDEEILAKAKAAQTGPRGGAVSFASDGDVGLERSGKGDGGDILLDLLAGRKRFDTLSAAQLEELVRWWNQAATDPANLQAWLTKNLIDVVHSTTPPVSSAPPPPDATTAPFSQVLPTIAMVPLADGTFENIEFTPTGMVVIGDSSLVEVGNEFGGPTVKNRKWFWPVVKVAGVAAVGLGGYLAGQALFADDGTVDVAGSAVEEPAGIGDDVEVVGDRPVVDPTEPVKLRTGMLDLFDVGANLTWTTLPDNSDEEADGFCNGLPLQELGEVEDEARVRYLDPAGGFQIDEEALRYRDVDAAQLIGRIQEQADSCESWVTSSNAGDVENTFTIVDEFVVAGADGGLEYNLTSLLVSNRPHAIHSAGKFFAKGNDLIHLRAAGSNPEGAAAQLAALAPVALAQFIDPASAAPETTTLIEWQRWAGLVEPQIGGQFAPLTFTPETYQDDLELYVAIVGDRVFLYEHAPPPTERAAEVEEMIDITKEQLSKVRGQLQATKDGDDAAAAAFSKAYIDLTALRERILRGLGVEPGGG